MANKKTPQSFLIAETRIIPEEFEKFKNHLGIAAWQSAADSDAEFLCEVAGKLCYLSFSTDLNDNLTRVGTRDNSTYVREQIVAQGHGSVLEHSTVSIAIMDCSRVLTHELVRHRTGTAFSQVSGRFVRNDNIGYYNPQIFNSFQSMVEGVDPSVASKLTEIFEREFAHQEEVQRELVEVSGINNLIGFASFSVKKMLTSAFRRLIGNGQTNHLLLTGNHRAWRHIIEMRTSLGAEEEARVAAYDIFVKLEERYPSIYADGVRTVADFGPPCIKFMHHKV